MKITNTLPLAFFLLASAAADAEPDKENIHPVNTVRVQLANDQSGANANKQVPTDGVKHSIDSLWGDTAVARHGVVFATSAQLTANFQNTACTISQPPKVHAELDSQRTWVSLDGGKVVELDHGFITCHHT
ncbi:hypothetical protein ASPWEDRAFT_294100 [Aspergillus wentii DTO 134E9]|uniref:Pectate lyase n=1 Tax=Aspergillus wentii DTO 134E9 TaxID=1073089 RepID=A0A1L9S4B3_ASPWE|nr:uncharacterized protein ASPWEDRAFT_294100 [Aspergillus wentii DTO 134E9]KAI9930286.1 hypothetical protein MW887_012099 [Aspergillus wentii]OJJ41963.1 hypothetical protein ASPWEDRAFT_294100 [Aspergillus wentii DTO 134E9]